MTFVYFCLGVLLFATCVNYFLSNAYLCRNLPTVTEPLYVLDKYIHIADDGESCFVVLKNGEHRMTTMVHTHKLYDSLVLGTYVDVTFASMLTK